MRRSSYDCHRALLSAFKTSSASPPPAPYLPRQAIPRREQPINRFGTLVKRKHVERGQRACFSTNKSDSQIALTANGSPAEQENKSTVTHDYNYASIAEPLQGHAADLTTTSSSTTQQSDRSAHPLESNIKTQRHNLVGFTRVNGLIDQGPHYENHGRAKEVRKSAMKQINESYARRRNRQRQRPSSVSMQDTFNFMRVHTNTITADWEAMRINGSAVNLSQLQKSLRDAELQCKPIVRTGSSYSMIITGPPTSLQQLQDSCRRTIQEKEQNGETHLDTAQLKAVNMSSAPKKQPDYYERRPFQRLFEERVEKATKRSRRQTVEGSTTELQALFDVYAGQPGVTFKGYRTALKFFLSHGNIKAAQDLLARAHQFDIALSIPSYNIFLEECAARGNLLAFDNIVRKMIDERVPFNGSTWLAFFKVVPNPRDKLRILKEMLRMGFDKYDNASHHLAEPVIRQCLGPFLDTGGSVQSYMSNLTALLGPHWPSPKAVLALVDVLVSRDLFIQALDTLSVIDKRFSFQPNTTILNTFLKHYTTQADLAKAVHALKEVSLRWPSIGPDRITFNRLWKLAWRLRSVNVAKTVWKHACATGNSYEMRNDLFPSLCHGLKLRFTGSAEDDSTSRSETWRRAAGLLIVDGGDRDLRIVPNTELTADQAGAEAEKLAQTLINEELDMAGKVVPTLPFADAVQQAWVMDREWAHIGIRKVIMDNATQHVFSYKVPMKWG